MIDFLLNDLSVGTLALPGTTVLDYLRDHRLLKGTKCGCREGDCGACTVWVGTLSKQGVRYKSMTSCLLPLANVQGKHVVTIEGINPPEGLSIIQQALADEGASQCGFCTPGFVMSLTAYCINEGPADRQGAIGAIDGNICRCTGYKSIERAIDRVLAAFDNPAQTPSIERAIKMGILPGYFAGIADRLATMDNAPAPAHAVSASSEVFTWVGGGTDLYVQKAETMPELQAQYTYRSEASQSIVRTDSDIEIGGAVVVSDLMVSPLINDLFPDITRQFKLISSTPIRNMATIAGNLVNASPIGDLSIWLLALDARVVLVSAHQTREVPLRNFFLGYKKLAKTPEELVQSIRFAIPRGRYFFHFEKVSKRTFLDIASVNTALYLEVEQGLITLARLSAGGVAPVPLLLAKTSAFLEGKPLGNVESYLEEANHIMQGELSPISDVRGSEAYKRLLLRQLLNAHINHFCAV